MKIENFHAPKSSFLSIDKDLSIITNKIISNNRIKKMLYYTTRDALSQPTLTEEQTMELFEKNIKIVPKLYVDGSVLNYIVISFDTFTETPTNPEFRDNVITFDIISHFDQWRLKDFELRPYKIAGEIDTMLDKQKLTGIGELHFLGANQMILNEEYGGVSLMYEATHGGEDHKFMPNPQDESQFIEDYEEMVKKQLEQKLKING